MSRRTETAYKAWSPGKLAQHNNTPDSGDRVNAAANVVKVNVLIRGELFGMRSLGIPTALDRLIQQSIAQVPGSDAKQFGSIIK